MMQYFFDASSIYYLSSRGKTRLLVRHYTSTLARYELGNILLKERKTRKAINEEQRKYLLGIISRALAFMSEIDAKNSEQEIINLAVNNDLSFYDSSYAYLAKANNLILVTQDGKLSRKITGYVETARAEDLA